MGRGSDPSQAAGGGVARRAKAREITGFSIDHLRRGNRELAARLEAGEVETHPFVIGELACGNLRQRNHVLNLIADLPHVPVAEHDEVMGFVDCHGLYGHGLGWIDMHLLASAALAGSALCSLDRRLAEAARRLDLA